MTTKHNHFTWMVGGEAGYGITTMGQMFSRACTQSGLYAFGYVEYPSLIRGGHNTAMVRVGSNPVHSHSDKVDMLLALNKETVDLHVNEMSIGGVIIYDGENVILIRRVYERMFYMLLCHLENYKGIGCASTNEKYRGIGCFIWNDEI